MTGSSKLDRASSLRGTSGDLTLYFVRHGESVANLSDRNGDKQAARRMASLRVAAEIGRRVS